MSMQARHEFYFGRVLPAEELIARVEAVTADDVGREAERLLDAEGAVALDRRQRRQVAAFGPGSGSSALLAPRAAW